MTEKATEQILSAAGNAVTGNFTFQAQMPNGKTVSVSGYLYDQETEGSINARLDLMADVMERQRLRAEIPELQRSYDAKFKALGDFRQHFAMLQERKEKGGKINTQEKQQLDVMDINLKKMIDDLAEGSKAIAAAKEKVGMS